MSTAIRAIHTGFRQLGITEDDDKRSLYVRVTGEPRLSLMKPAQQDAVLAELRRLGFASADARPAGRRQLTGKYAKKLQALWIAGWNLGVIHDRDDRAMLGFVKDQTGVDDTRFLHDPADGRAAVEGLKAWLKREAGVRFGTTCGQEWLAADGAKIAWAQWRILHPGVDLILRRGFDEVVYSILGVRRAWLGDLKPKDWQAVMNALGEEVRAAKKGKRT
ncbi:regulatory protein GemA [Shinella pollutisoli]|uniref:Regulatory protein GemA n=1 Tax=Shinella pollutisoli TaxID=2250594 RepID=A0ABV7DJ79_9HYPH